MNVRFAAASLFSASLIFTALLAGAAPPPAHTPPSKGGGPAPPSPRLGNDPSKTAGEVDPKWLDHIPKDDRAALDPLIGYAPPEFTKDVKWLSGEPATWDSLRGRVVVIQSWTTATTAARNWPERIAKALKSFQSQDLAIIALHTPDGAENADDILKKQRPPESVAIAIDPVGKFCDDLGMFKQPVNIIVDRQGAVRYAALNATGLEKAVAALVAEPFDQSKAAPVRPAEKPEAASSSPSGDFPPYSGAVNAATDLRGKKAPEFFVAQWITKEPKAEGKVVVIDFWATWCGPCVAAIPHMNELSKHFGDQVCCIGISDESKNDFEKGLLKRKLKPNSFQYNVGLDPAGKMYHAINITAIPHCIVMSKDWVVRWQGHPAGLTAETLAQIVKADSGGGAGGSTTKSPGGTKPRGWVRG